MKRNGPSTRFHLVTIFFKLRSMPCDQWDDRIAEYCGDDVELAREVRHLLVDDRRTRGRCPHARLLVNGRYQLETELGGGASGTVWRALDTKIEDRRVAIKLLHPEDEGDRGLMRAYREASAASRVVSDHVVRIEDVGLCQDAGAYLVMELCAEPVHGALHNAQSLSATSPTSLHEVIRWSIQIARGAHALHEQGVFHLDLKPDNVLIRPRSRRAQVVDFGLARRSGPRTVGAAQVSGRSAPAHPSGDGECDATRYAGPQGTLCFMAPEQARGMRRDLDPDNPKDYDLLSRVDVYGVGAILYQLLSGRPPFVDMARDSRANTLLRLMRTSAPTPLGARRSWPPPFRVPRRLARIVGKAMARDSQRRYGSCAELANDLERYLGHRTTSLDARVSVTYARLWTVRHRRLLAALIPVAVLAGAVANRHGTILRYNRERLAAALNAQLHQQRAQAEHSPSLSRAQAPEPAEPAAQAREQVVEAQRDLPLAEHRRQAARRRPPRTQQQAVNGPGALAAPQLQSRGPRRSTGRNTGEGPSSEPAIAIPNVRSPPPTRPGLGDADGATKADLDRALASLGSSTPANGDRGRRRARQAPSPRVGAVGSKRVASPATRQAKSSPDNRVHLRRRVYEVQEQASRRGVRVIWGNLHSMGVGP